MKAQKFILPLALASGAAIVAAGLALKRSIPKNAKAVKPFDLKKYLGTWYEIARFDYLWEKHMDHVTATYSLNEDGSIRVDNKGYDHKKDKWEESVGKAKPVDDPKEAKLKVSFFGPFYAGYNVIAIDKDYRHALVLGEKTDYLWLLSRDKDMPDSIKDKYMKKAAALGCDIDKLVWTKQD
jgi:apolipoprotein D and lipocalin family protein